MGVFDKIKKAVNDSGFVDATKNAVSSFKETIGNKTVSSDNSLSNADTENIRTLAVNDGEKVNKDSSEESFLIDEEWELTREICSEFNELMTTNAQISFLNNKVYPYKTFQRVSAIKSLITESILIYGIDPKRNDFLDFITKLDIEMTDRSFLSKMTYIYNAYKNGFIDLRDSEVLYNPTLYIGRNDKEFQYTVNCFFYLPSHADSYLIDTSKVDIMSFFNGDNLAKSEIKPAGIDGEEGDTIFNIVEGWSKDNEL